MVLFCIKLNEKYYYSENDSIENCIIKISSYRRRAFVYSISSLLDYIISYNNLCSNYKQFILYYAIIFKNKIKDNILHDELSLKCLSKEYLQTSTFVNECLDTFDDWNEKVDFIFRYLYYINNISSNYCVHLKKNSFATIIRKELNENNGDSLNIQKYTMEYFESFGFYYYMLKMESNDKNYKDSCRYIITVYGLFDRLYMQSKNNKTRMDLLSQKNFLANKFNQIYELLNNGALYEKLLKDPKLKCINDNMSIFKSSKDNNKDNNSEQKIGLEQHRNDYTNMKVDPDYFNKLDSYFYKEFDTKESLGQMSKPSWLDSSKTVVYLYSKPVKERSKIFLGKYEYHDGVFELTNENTYKYCICRIERLVYYLLKQELHLFSTNKKLNMTLQSNIFKSAKYRNIEHFTLDDLYSDIREQYVSLYEYKEREDNKKILLEKEKSKRKEYWDSLSDEEQKKIKAMYAKKNNKEKNSTKNIDEVLAKQEASATVIENRPKMNLSSRGTSISINNHIKKIEETDIGLKVYMTYKFYDLSNPEDKKGFLEALTYKLKMKDIDTKLYKVSSIKRTKLYAECLEIELIKK